MSQNKNLRIIVIDDNPAIHEDFIKILTTARKNSIRDAEFLMLDKAIFGDVKQEAELPKFEIDTAAQGKEGFDKIVSAVQNGMPYSLAFVDIRMPPGWDGIETIKNIWNVDENIQVVICTAYSDYSWEDTVDQLGQRDNLLILKKPFDNIAVRQLACALTKKWQLVHEAQQYTRSLEEHVKERTKSINTSLSLMRATFESSADGILVVSDKNEVIDYNNKLSDMWRIPQSILDTRRFDLMVEFITEKLINAEDYLQQVHKLMKHEDEVIIGTIKFKDKRIIEYYTQPYTLNDETIGRVWSFRDVSKRANLEEELQYQATHDVLTGLPNRVLLLDRIRNSIMQADRNKTMFGVFFLDLDRFKLINDSLSHEAGDDVLQNVAMRLQSMIREVDTLARLGGDEFVVVMNDIKQESQLNMLASKLLSVFQTAFTYSGRELILTTSIGICVYPKDGKNIDVLLRNADTAMYHAKELGANQYQYYTDELNQKNMERLENEGDLRRAIAHEEFYLHYQPQIDVANERLVSVEALIRWQHPVKGTVLPMDFIPLAEESGLIVPIGEWVLRTACRQLVKWQKDGLSPIRVAVNVTTKQFRLYNFAEVIADILKETGLEAKYLELELTENIIINNLDVVKTIHELKQMGVQIALDDFGTGYSSLNYLRHIPIDRIKIDQSFVQNIDSNRGDDVIIKAIIAMAKSLDLDVLAEGVETQDQLEFLKGQQCAEVQGYYYSKPVSSQDFEKLLRESSEKQVKTSIETD